MATSSQHLPHSPWVLLETIILYFLTTVGLSFFSLKRFLKLSAACPLFRTQDHRRLQQIRFYTRLLNRLLRKGPNSLRDSLVLMWAASEAQLMVATPQGPGQARAWVECQGESYTFDL